MKYRLRDELAYMIIKDEKFKFEDLIKYIVERNGGKTITACARSGYRQIFNRYN